MAWIRKDRKRGKGKKEGSLERKERSKVYSLAAWRRLRDLKRRNDPMCEVCLIEGKLTPGEDVHHLRSFMCLGGNARIEALLDYGNLVTLCKVCHQRLHHGTLKGSESIDEIKRRLEIRLGR